MQKISQLLNKISIPKLLLCLVVVFPFILSANQTLVQSYSDFFLTGPHTSLDAIFSWKPNLFGSSTSIEIWRLFPLSVYFYLANNVVGLPSGVSLALLMAGISVLAFLFFIKSARMLFGDRASHISDTTLGIGALYFLFNPYTVTQLSDSFLLVMPYLVLPIQVYIMLKGLESRQYLRYGVLLGLINMSVFGVNLIFAVIAIAFLVCIALWKVLVEKRYKLVNVGRLAAAAAIVSILSVSFWLAPMLQGSLSDQATTQSVLASEDFYNLDSSFLKVVRGLGAWGFFSGNKGIPYHSYSPAYNFNPLVLAGTFLIPLMVLLPLIFREKVSNYVSWRNLALFYVLLFILFPVIGGTHPSWPTHGALEWAFANIPYFSAFRNTYKFSSLLVYCFALLLPVALILINSRVNKKAYRLGIQAAIIAFVIAGAFPFFTGKLYSDSDNINSIPEYWRQMANHVNNTIDENATIFTLPNQYFEVLEWPEGLKSFPRNLETVLFKPSIVHNVCKGCGQAYTSDFLKYAYENNQSKDVFKLLALHGVSNILQRNDYASSYYDVESPAQVAMNLAKYPDIKKTATYGKLDLYSLPKNDVNRVFYGPDTITEVSKYDEANDVVNSADDSKRPAYVFNTQETSRSSRISESANYYKRLFDPDESKLRDNAVVSNSFKTTKSQDSYSIQKNSTTRNVYRMSYNSSDSGYSLNLTEVQVKLSLDGKTTVNASESSTQSYELGSYPEDIAITVANKAYILKKGQSGTLDTVTLAGTDNAIEVYKTGNNLSGNLVENGSFELGSWQKQVQNCQRSTDGAALRMELVNGGTNGQKALQLAANRDSACTYSPALKNFSPGVYSYSIDTRNIKGYKPSYCIWDGNGCVKSETLNGSKDWKTSQDAVLMDGRANNFYMFLYSQKNNSGESVNEYDNLQVRRFNTRTATVKLNLPATAFQPKTVDIKAGDHSVDAQLSTSSGSLIDNGSFESGTWEEEVRDCRGAKNAQNDLGLSSDKTDGKQSLKISSANSAACISSYTLVNFDRQETYAVSFDYKVTKGKEARYCIWDGKQCLIDEKIPSNGSTWKTHRQLVKPRDDSSSFSVYLYAESAEKKAAEVLYDKVDVRQIEASPFDTYKLVNTQTREVNPLQVGNYTKINPTSYRLELSIRNKAPLIFLQSYHPGWRAFIVPHNQPVSVAGYLRNSSVGYEIPRTNHFIANGFTNGWLVDPNDIPAGYGSDGSYSVAILYEPQQYVYMGAIISGIAVSGSMAYLAISYIRRRKTEPTGAGTTSRPGRNPLALPGSAHPHTRKQKRTQLIGRVARIATKRRSSK